MKKKSFADIIASMDSGLQRKIAGKIPSWTGLEVPGSLAFEQCSSERTAAYKLRFVPQGAVVADLTGGLGVDSAAFASCASKVFYYEQNTQLCEAAGRNFQAMNLPVSVCNTVIGTQSDIPQCDLIYADPARRSTAGKKVFLLEDCTPNVLELLPLLCARAPRILFKLSPMADVSLVEKRLREACALLPADIEAGVKEIHVVELGGEVKELLIYMERGFSGEAEVTAASLGDRQRSFSFLRSQERQTPVRIAFPKAGDMLFVPSGAILKAGAYNSLGLERLAEHSHLYLSGAGADGLDSLPGRCYAVEKVLPMSSASIKELAGTYEKADVSCHDVPMRSEELAKRLKCKSGGDHHIFASSSAEGRILIICRKLQ